MKRILGPAMIVLSLILSVAALAIGGAAYLTARQLRLGLLEAVVQARAAVSDLPTQSVEVPIHIQETFPISAQVPIREEFTVPIQTVLPIATEVEVPLNLPLLGERQIRVPIKADVPIRVEVTIPISRTVALETALTVDTEIPVQIDLEGMGITEILGQLDARLAEVEDRLR